MNSLFAELVSSCRLPRRSPGFACTVIAVLALGVGANTAIFSVIDAFLLHPFLGQSIRVVLLGLVLGLAGAFALARLLGSQLYETSTRDPWTFGAVGLALGAVGLLASVLPALRASRISPLEAFRAD